MAWRSSGTTNIELVDNMVQNGLITRSEVEEGFRRVDRKHFVPKGCEAEAYCDRPIKEGHVHISAPHIYCTVLEALDLTPGASLSFLNIGSGTGYLTCIASEILGPKSLYYGIEIYQDVLKHCQKAVATWYANSPMTQSSKIQPYMQFIHGNGLDIQVDVGESLVGFDRIYAGAALNYSQLVKIQNLLRPGGVMVAPVDDDLLKIVRRKNKSQKEDFIIDSISGVTFAPLVSQPQINTVIPSAQWSTSNHHLYPKSFQDATKTILLCRNSNIQQHEIVQKTKESKNMSACLPKEVWLHILSFTTRTWFEPVNYENEVEFLQHRLEQEQRNLNNVRRSLSGTESRNRQLQRQNEMYLQIGRQFYEQVQQIFQDSANGSPMNIRLSPEMLQSTESLLQQSREILYPANAQVNMSIEMMDGGGDSDDDSDDDSDEEDADDEMDDSFAENTGDSLMFDSSTQVPSERNSRQIRTVSISSTSG